MPGRSKEPLQCASSPSILDLFILSMVDRGLQTSYALHRDGGLSVGSTVPALRRLEEACLVKRTEVTATNKRPRHGYQLFAPGRKLASSGWIPLLKHRPPTDLDAVLRLADLANHYGTKVVDIASLLQRAAKDRVVMSKQASAAKVKDGVASLLYVSTKNDWDASRLTAEAKFLTALAKSLTREDAGKPKRGLRPRADRARR
jgi:DNA-binding PadR family transcriptional regulator